MFRTTVPSTADLSRSARKASPAGSGTTSSSGAPRQILRPAASERRPGSWSGCDNCCQAKSPRGDGLQNRFDVAAPVRLLHICLAQTFLRSSMRFSFSWRSPVIRLKEATRFASSSKAWHSTRYPRFPDATAAAPCASAWIGTVIRLARYRPNQENAKTIRSVERTSISRVLNRRAVFSCCSCWYFSNASITESARYLALCMMDGFCQDRAAIAPFGLRIGAAAQLISLRGSRGATRSTRNPWRPRMLSATSFFRMLWCDLDALDAPIPKPAGHGVVHAHAVEVVVAAIFLQLLLSAVCVAREEFFRRDGCCPRCFGIIFCPLFRIRVILACQQTAVFHHLRGRSAEPLFDRGTDQAVGQDE